MLLKLLNFYNVEIFIFSYKISEDSGNLVLLYVNLFVSENVYYRAS